MVEITKLSVILTRHDTFIRSEIFWRLRVEEILMEYFTRFFFFFLTRSNTLESSTEPLKQQLKMNNALVWSPWMSPACVVSFIARCCLLPHVFSEANYNINNWKKKKKERKRGFVEQPPPPHCVAAWHHKTAASGPLTMSRPQFDPLRRFIASVKLSRVLA